MKKMLAAVLMLVSLSAIGQNTQGITTLDFVKIVERKSEEAMYFYKNNWLRFREMAFEKGLIQDFQLLQTSDNIDYDLILLTTYADSSQYQAIESHFANWRQENSLRLLNELPPNSFRINVKAISTKVVEGSE